VVTAAAPASAEPAARGHWLGPALGACAGMALAGAALALLGLSWAEIRIALLAAAPAPLAAAAAGSLGLLALQALRWWALMRPVAVVRYRHAFGAMAVAFLLNAVLPGRGGDLLRVQWLGRRTGVSRAKLLGTEIVDLVSDKWGWIAAFPVLCVVEPPPGWLLRALGLLVAALALGSAVLALMASRLGRRADGASRGPGWVGNLRDGFAAQRWKRLAAVATVLAPLPWLWETLLVAVAARSLGIALSPMEAFATLTAFNLAMVVPAPANVGSFEAGGAVALVGFGVARPSAMALMILYHLTQLVPGVLLGAAVLAWPRRHEGARGPGVR
jgi:uncharacterized membrane protein YbhN (UPF0104 family)